MKFYKNLILALLLIPAIQGKAQFQKNAFENSFKHLNTLNGLSNDFVNQVVKDQNGFLWIATQNGLNRYDGVHVKTFYHNSNNANSICGNYISCLLADSRGRIWIGTAETGISVYDCLTQKIHSYRPNDSIPNQLRPYEYITSFYEDNQKRIWITTWGSGLYLFDEKTNSFEQFIRTPNQANPKLCVKSKSILQDKKGNFWVGLWAEGPSDTIGIQIFDPEKKTFHNYYSYLKGKFGGEVPKPLRTVLKFVHYLAIDEQNKLWVAGLLGMAYIDLNNFSYKVYVQEYNSDFSSINSKTIRCIAFSGENHVFAGSLEKGLNILDNHTNKFSYITTESESETSLNSNTIKHVLVDENEMLYVSTSGGGLNISLPQQQEYKFFGGKNIKVGSLSTGSGITAIGGTEENLLLGGNFGLIQWNKRTGKTTKYLDTESRKISISSNYIFNGYEEDIAYLATSNNFYRINTTTQNLSFVRPSNIASKSNLDNINSVVNWNKDSLLVLSEYLGIQLVNINSNKITHFNPNQNHLGFWYAISRLDKENLLAGYMNGVVKINLRKNTVSHLLADSIPLQNVKGWTTTQLYCDREKRWWFACDSSLGLLNYPNKGYRMFPIVRNELLVPILGIQEDEKGNLWLHSQYEVYHFNTTTKVFTLLRSNLVKSNHVAGKQSYLDLQTGIYYVTSAEGIWSIDTRLFYNNSKLKKISITDFYLIKGHLENSADFINSKSLSLSYKQNSFSIHFSNFDYEQNKNYEMEYKLEGTGVDWATVSKSQIIEINNLDPGDYKLVIKYKGFAETDDTSLALKIHISKPFWQTWWFLLTTFMALGGGILYYIRRNTQQLEERNLALELKVSERTKELQIQKKQSEDLLLNILPADIVTELKENGSTNARLHENATVMFADFVNFTGISSRLSPADLVREIDRCFKAFDQIIDKYGIEKIKTIGDSYMAVGGLNRNALEDTISTINAAFEIIEFVKNNNCLFEIRIGINSGSVIAGVVGHKKFAYDIWGSTVNIASRMESNGIPMKINISQTTFLQIKDHFTCTYRGDINVKNMGEMKMYLVN